jgi:excisionase family DNA binding protein
MRSLKGIHPVIGSVNKMTRKARAKNWLSVGKVSEYCLVSTATVRRWIKNGDLSSIRLPSGHYRVGIAEFKDFLKRHDMPIKEELNEND